MGTIYRGAVFDMVAAIKQTSTTVNMWSEMALANKIANDVLRSADMK